MANEQTPAQSPTEAQSPFRPPAVSLPKGGGAIRSMGEKFAANPVTGTGSLSVPIATSPGGQHIVFERAVYPDDPTSSLWIMNRDGSGLHELADDAGRPAWGRTPPPLKHRVYLPVVVR